MSEVKPREFFATQIMGTGDTPAYYMYHDEAHIDKMYHLEKLKVIEYSAYLAEKARADDLQFLLDRINSEVVPGVRDSGDAGVYLMKKLEAENTRLREALNLIIDNDFRYGTALVNGEEKTPMRIAREALERN